MTVSIACSRGSGRWETSTFAATAGLIVSGLTRQDSTSSVSFSEIAIARKEDRRSQMGS